LKTQLKSEVTHQSIIISGASSGIGRATAFEFAKNGYDLLLLGRNEKRLNEVETLCFKLNPAIQIENYACDILKIEEAVLIKKLQHLKPVTALVNNAGIYLQKGFEETTLDEWQNIFNINFLGSVHLTKLIWPVFLKNKKGSIVNVSSTLGIKPISHTSAYSSLKAAMINWTQTLAIEGGAHNIRANVVCPGIIDTPIHPFHRDSVEQKKNLEKNLLNIQLLKNLGQPENVAQAIYFLASPQSEFTTGSILNIDGGINIK
jgi:NAD(P)-dependent dehydrogenase (short-subunit alcohol dehydrogenase family)